MSFYGFPKYVSVAEKRKKAEKAIDKLRKKKPDISPIIIEGTKLAKTWWGRAWNDNLESYSDYSNRIGRGRSYVRNRAVLDLKINGGNIVAFVQGSSSQPYIVRVEISPLNKGVWENIKKSCEGKIESLHELIDGKFPKALSELFTAKGSGLFPAPKEIKLSCDCPDGATMCKHIAAVLYGIGARLDEKPELFFSMRDVNISDLITEAIEGKAKSILGKTGRGSRRILDDVDVTDMFGVEVEADVEVKKVKKRKKISE